jgi:pyruvate dehydrogenase E1 component alpha subunit
MLVADLEVGHLGGRGVVGAGVPIGTGAALSAKLRGSRQVCVSFFGDGASNQGVVHEAMNLAAVWKLPQVFVCENNQYGLATHVSISTSVRDISKRAAAYGMRGISINGMDVLAVDEAARESIAAARKGHGPSLIECKTYRYMGHSGTKRFEIYGKPYRSEKEIEQWMRKDPVKSFKARLIKMRSLTEERHEEMVKEIRKEIEEAVQFAIDSPDPKPEEALEGLFAT